MMGNSISYVAEGGSQVFIPKKLNPRKILNVSANATEGEVKNKFRRSIQNPMRQQRAQISLAYYIITMSAYNGYNDGDFEIMQADQFIYAAVGYTEQLRNFFQKNRNQLAKGDLLERTVLYLAARAGFYDTCKLLISLGADVNQVQKSGSTALHAAAYFGQTIIVGLLLQAGADQNYKNNFGHIASAETEKPEIIELIKKSSEDDIANLLRKLRKRHLANDLRLIFHPRQCEKVIGKEITRGDSSMDFYTSESQESVLKTWLPVWHGTKYQSLEPILEHGFLPSGTAGISPQEGHIAIDKTVAGFKNWAAAIFVSPSLLYSADIVYAKRIFSEGRKWCCLVKAYCKPESFSKHNSTLLFRSTPELSNEPQQAEYRVAAPPEEPEAIFRVEFKRNVIVRSIVFINEEFLENVKNDGINYEELQSWFL